jgi:glycosidase
MGEFVFGSLSTTEKRADAFQASRRGVKHQYCVEPQAVRPGESPVLTVTVELSRRVEQVECVVSELETASGQAVYPLNLVKTEWDLLNWSYYQIWQVALPPQLDGTLVRYRILAYPADGSEPIPADDGAVFSYLVGDPAQPDWAREAIVYQIFPDRFFPGNGRAWNPTNSLDDIYGGTLRGVIEKLDYIADLGFNVIWLNPFFPDDTHHGYHATDYFAVNPRLGTLGYVRELVAAAHERGIHLLLDFVANHWSSEHHTFRAAQADRNSEFYDWYTWIDWPHEYESFFGVKELPQINLEYRPAREHMLKAARYWLADVGFDGLRLDYVLGPSHDFWTELRAVVKAINPDIWLFGEAVDAPDAQLKYQGRFDGTLDFLLAQALRDTFGQGTMDVAAFDAFLTQHEAYFPAGYGRPTFLDNHDQNRFLWITGGDKRKLKLAALCQFTLSGAPIVYNGTEVGVSQARDRTDPASDGMAEVRQPMLWGKDQDKDLLNYYRWLIHFRRQHPVLLNGTRQTLHVDKTAGTYVYVLGNGDETILVALNLSDQIQNVTVKTPGTHKKHHFALSAWSGDVRIEPVSN